MSRAIVKEMCEGCGWMSGNICKVIQEPLYFYEKRGKFFAKATKERAQEIDREISLQGKGKGRRKMEGIVGCTGAEGGLTT